jgi:hypothetical protein
MNNSPRAPFQATPVPSLDRWLTSTSLALGKMRKLSEIRVETIFEKAQFISKIGIEMPSKETKMQ